MKFYYRICFLIAIGAVAMSSFAYFTATKNSSFSRQADFKIIKKEMIDATSINRGMGKLHLEILDPNRGGSYVEAQIDPGDLDLYQVGDVISGLYVDKGEGSFAYVGKAAEVNPIDHLYFGLFFFGIFSLLGFILYKKSKKTSS